MASRKEFVDYVCEQINEVGIVTSKKMFGEYMIYVNKKPILLVCDDTVFVKKLDCLFDLMKDASKANPYNGAKEHYILDIDNNDLSKEVVTILEKVTPIPKAKKK